MTRRLLGRRPFSTLSAALAFAAIGGGLVGVVYHDAVYMKTERRLHRAEHRVDELERETDKVRAAGELVDRVRQETANYREENLRLERILPRAFDPEAEAMAILERLEDVPVPITVEPAGEAKDRGFFFEHDFIVTFEDATREELHRAIDLIHSGLPLRTVTRAVLPQDIEEPFATELTVTCFVYKTE